MTDSITLAQAIQAASASSLSAENVVKLEERKSTSGCGRAASRKAEDMKKAYFMSTRADFVKEFIKPLLDSSQELAECCFRIGQADEKKKEVKIGDQVVNRRSMHSLVKNHANKIEELAHAYEQALKHGGKRRKTAPQKNFGAFSNLWKYDVCVGDFFREAAEKNSRLASWANLKMCQDGPLRGVSQPKTITRLITTYIRANNLQCEKNGQYNAPDDLLRKHFGAQIDRALAKQHDKRPEDAVSFPGMLRYTTFQSIFGFLHDTEAEKLPEVEAILKDPDNIAAYEEDYKMIQEVSQALKEESKAKKPRAKQSFAPRVSMKEKMEQTLKDAIQNVDQGLAPFEGIEPSR